MKRVLSIVLAVSMVLALPIGAIGYTNAANGNSSSADFNAPGHYTLSEVTEMFSDRISGDDMLLFSAFVYLGWRTSYGNWLNAVMEGIMDGLVDNGFQDQKRTTAGNQGDSVWFEYGDSSGNTTNNTTWNPQYASLKVVDPPDPEDMGSMPQDEREALIEEVNFLADCIDPTSMYYPDYVTPEWLVDTLDYPGSPDYIKQQQVNHRVHLATNTPFTAVTDPGKTAQENIEAGTVVAEVVDVGRVTAATASAGSTSKGIDPSTLRGKIILADGNSSRSTVRSFAANVGAIAGMCNQLNYYNMPTIDGVQWYTNAAQYAGAGNYTANSVVAFNTSLDQYEALSALCADGPTYLEICVLGTYGPSPIRYLVAEIQGATKPQERIIVPAHINEPGACDNATGVAMGYEIAKTLKQMIDDGTIARPDRTITFIWGDEIAMTRNWIAAYRSEFMNFKGSIDLDMVGEDPVKTGGPMLIEKTPDPSGLANLPVASVTSTTNSQNVSDYTNRLVYRYENTTFPGQSPVNRVEFTRQPDRYSLWAGTDAVRRQPFNNYPGFFLNDLYLQTALLVQRTNPGFEVSSNPFGGGSDHEPFIAATSSYGAAVPALLTWHFTDYVYHSSCDTLDKISVQELHDVGTVSATVAYQMANSGEPEVADMMEHVLAGWKTRLAGEKLNSLNYHSWWLVNRLGTETNAYNKELKAIADWSRWYIDAIRSCGQYFIGEELGMPYRLSPALQQKQDEYIGIIQEDVRAALANVDRIWGKADNPVQIASAYLPQTVFVPVGTTQREILDRLPATIEIEYIGGGTGTANVTWGTVPTGSPNAMQPTFNISRTGLYKVTGTLSGFEAGVVNWAHALGIAQVITYSSAIKPGVFLVDDYFTGLVRSNIRLTVDAVSYDGGTLSYEWYTEDGEFAGTGAEFYPPTDMTGTFRYYAVVTNTNDAAPGLKTAVAQSGLIEVVVKTNMPVTSVETGNGQANVNFPIVSANGKGYTVYLSKTGQYGEFTLYSNVNYNSKGAHIKGLANGATYWVYIKYSDGAKDTYSEKVMIRL